MNERVQALKHLVYISSATQLFTREGLEELLNTARENNSREHVSGMLLYRGGNFIQVLEGPSSAVDQIFASIEQDSRHKDVTVLLDEAITRCDFRDWSMAFNGNDQEKIEGLSDFLKPYASRDELKMPEGTVKKLLSRFKIANKQ